LDGQPIIQPSPKVAMVFQRMALFPWETVMGNVAIGPKFNGFTKQEREEKAAHYIKMVGLAGFEKSFPHQLSG
ncbi:ABC transporter ATP-binding protein, partial [Salmonella enterica subsp. enterica serovar Kentucky]